ncbi:macrolide family glycosyltransferase [Saccharopolyspora griseoalba]|uniref:Macrolide family glycosyltransferase n=1 Tax=Saccharopolyspora griseoalba TaxID=1431848 RepID=A0ABW2LJT7_9PSEU
MSRSAQHSQHVRAAHIAFFSIPAHGHVNPGLGLVAELAARGHRVSYATTHDFAPQVTEAGATPVVYRSLLPGSAGISRDEWPEDEAEAQQLFLDETKAVLPQVEEAFAADRPDLIIYDIAGFPALVLSEKWVIPRVQLSPTHVYSEGIEEVMGNGETTPEKEAVRARYAEFFAEQGTNLTFRDVGFPVRSIVTIPRTFQYFGDRVDEIFTFVGPMLSERGFQGDWQAPDERPVLVISLGSAYNDRLDFYRRCLLAFGDLDWHVVLATGRAIDPAELGELPANFEVHQWIPQLRVLSQASAFLTHAGTGGVMEGLHHGVPLIAAPQAVDQFANAARIDELALGVQVDAGAVTPEELRTALDRVSTDEKIRRSVREMRREIRRSGGLNAAVEIVESHLPD